MQAKKNKALFSVRALYNLGTLASYIESNVSLKNKITHKLLG